MIQKVYDNIPANHIPMTLFVPLNNTSKELFHVVPCFILLGITQNTKVRRGLPLDRRTRAKSATMHSSSTGAQIPRAFGVWVLGFRGLGDVGVIKVPA